MLEFSKIAQGKDWAVASGSPYAVQAAVRILQQGGSAVDAAIAADAVMGVVEPMATSLGGDLLAMIVPIDGQPVSYNGSGRAPGLLRAEHVRDFPGQRIPERHVFSITTPGLVRGWEDIHLRYGSLPWAELFRDAIQLAAEGYVLGPVAAREWKIFDFTLHHDPHCASLYGAGSPPQSGACIRNPALAKTLEAIAEQGADAFYLGATADRIEQAMLAAGGLLRARDLALHQGEFCSPLTASVFGTDVYQCPPNTHGMAVLEALRNYELSMQADSSFPLALLIDATKQAMQLAQQSVCDPAGNTVCTVIRDPQGMAITLMSSIFKRFGAGYVAPDTGFVLQNRGFGFSAPGHINGPAAYKRPYHTVVPAVALRDARFYMGLGVVGGLMQPQGQIQIWAKVLGEQLALQSAIQQPRWRLETGLSLAIEAGFCAQSATQLRALGYEEPMPGMGELAGRSDFGGAQAIQRQGDGTWLAVSDPRKDGAAAAA